MNTTRKLKIINTSVVDKLPSIRTDVFSKFKDKDTQSLRTDQAKHNDEETSYVLEEKSTIDEGEMTPSVKKYRADANCSNSTVAENNTVDGDEAFSTAASEGYTAVSGTGTYLNDRDVMSMSGNSSANFSFFPQGEENGDAYPALYNPEVQAQYEKMKIEEEERKYQEMKWAPVMTILASLQVGMTKMLSYLDSLCDVAEVKQKK